MSVLEMVKEIRENTSQKSINKKQEVLVYQELLNDHTYKASVLNKKGEVEDYICPAEEMDNMSSNIISKTTGMGLGESAKLMETYEYTKNDAQHMLNTSKEFLNVYLETGRKISLGKRVDTDITLEQKVVQASKRHFSKKVGIDENGKDIRETVYKDVPEHKTIKVKCKY